MPGKRTSRCHLQERAPRLQEQRVARLRYASRLPIERAHLALEGAAVGDTVGETFFGATDQTIARIEKRQLKQAPWPYTDDTEMAISIFESWPNADASKTRMYRTGRSRSTFCEAHATDDNTS